MKKLLLAILFLCGTFAVRSEPAKASGATVVFLKVRFQDYFLTSAIRDKAFNSSKLYNYLESSHQHGIYVSRIDPFLFRTVSYYTAHGYDVELAFEKDEDIVFHYYPAFKAIIGLTEDEDIVVLLPRTQASGRPEYPDTIPSAQQHPNGPFEGNSIDEETP